MQGFSWRVQGVGFRDPGSEAQVVREGDEADSFAFRSTVRLPGPAGPKENTTATYLEKTKTKTSTSSLGLKRRHEQAIL